MTKKPRQQSNNGNEEDDMCSLFPRHYLKNDYLLGGLGVGFGGEFD